MSGLDLPAWSEPFTDVAGLARRMRLRGISRDWAWGGSTGAGIRVGIVDSGLEASHPRLNGRVVESVAVQLVDGEPEVVPDDGIDLYGHATACGGIILGMAPQVELVSIRVLGADLRGKGAAFAAGLEWAIDQGIDVLNLSLSSKSEAMFSVFHELVDRAYFRGIPLVSAANNVPAASYPSLFSTVISVAAHGEADPWRLYYNPSPPVEFGAWGVDVPIAWKDGGTSVATGNSFAAPHVTGMVALILAKHRGLTPFEVKSVLAAVADNPRRTARWALLSAETSRGAVAARRRRSPSAAMPRRWRAAGPARRHSRRNAMQFRQRCSRSSSSRLRGSSPVPHPLQPSTARTTRWQGTAGKRGQRAIAPPTARAAPGCPAAIAMSP